MTAKNIIDSVAKYKSRRTVMPDGSVVIKGSNGLTMWKDSSGELHRDGGPAIEYPGGSYSWYKHGQLHRLGGPAYKDSSGEHWYVDGKHHRDGGPAISWKNGSEHWLNNGRYHRIGGPAKVVSGGKDIRDEYDEVDRNDYYVHGRRFTEDEYYSYVDQDTGEVLVPPGKKLTYEIHGHH